MYLFKLKILTTLIIHTSDITRWRSGILSFSLALIMLISPIASADSITQNSQPSGSNTNCPEQTLYDPDSQRCVAQRDMRNLKSLDSKGPDSSLVPNLLDLRSKTTPQRQGLLIDIPPPGGIGAGIVYRKNELKALWSSRFYTKMFVHPDGLYLSSPSLEWLFTTHTNRTEKGVEPVGIYRQLDPASPRSDFGIFDWSCSEQFPCSSGPGPAWQWTRPLSGFACNISKLIDQGGHSQQYMKLSNSTIKLDNGDPPLWKNQVNLWNFCDGIWDLIYEHEYRVHQKDCRSGTCGWWGPILETFGTMPEIGELGFEDSILYHDGLESFLTTAETDFYQPISQWQLFHRHPNRSFGTGNFLDIDKPISRVRVLGDINGDGTEDIAVMVHDKLENMAKVWVRDAENDALIQTVEFDMSSRPVDFELMDDINANGAPELVVLGIGSTKVEVRDSLTGELMSAFQVSNDRPIDLAVLADQNGNGMPELAVLGRSTQNGSLSVNVKDALTNQLLNRVGFNPNFTPLELVILDDLNGNRKVEIAVLGIDGNAAGQDRVEIRDSATDTLLNNVYYGASIQAKRLTVLADQNNNTAQELVVLRQGNWVEVRINDALNDSLLNRIGFTPGFILSQVLVIPDLNGNGVPELGALGINPNTNQVRVQVRDSLTDASIRNVYFGKNFQPLGDVELVNDINGNGSPELVYLGKRESDGKLRVIIRDALTAALINTVDF